MKDLDMTDYTCIFLALPISHLHDHRQCMRFTHNGADTLIIIMAI